MNWIKLRLNKDNFWNLIFWFGIYVSVLLSEQVVDFSGIASLMALILSLTLVPYLLTRWNKPKYNNDKIFLNSRGISLANNLPKRLGIVLLFNIFFTGACISKNFNELTLSSIIAIALILPISYFIYKNCPISILFNKNAWQEEIIGVRSGEYKVNLSHSSFNNTSYNSISRHSTIKSPDIINDPSYRYLSSNIYNSNR